MDQFVIGSCAPHTYAGAHGLDMLATAYHQGVMKRTAKSPRMAADVRQLLEYCNGLPLPTTANCWQPEIGAVMRALERDDPAGAVVQALFAMHALRVAGAWHIRLHTPVRVSVMGHLFELAGRVSVQADAALLTITRHDDGEAQLQLHWEAGAWRCATLPAVSWLYVAPAFVDHDAMPSLYVQTWPIPAGHQQGDDVIADWPPHATSSVNSASAAQQLHAALEILAGLDASYLQWIQPLFRGIAACAVHDPDSRVSASFASHAGVVTCGFPLSDDYLAENIVHEVSHQHFLLVDAAFPLVKKTAHEASYFSSLKKKKRSLKKIFMAYHALANMGLFWYDYRARYGTLTAVQQVEMDYVVYNISKQIEIIAGNDGLTSAGVTLFERQNELLAERGLIQ